MDHEGNQVTDGPDTTYDRYTLYHAVLRRAIFWYYLQDSDLRPEATPDDQYTCARFMIRGGLGCSFALYHYRRINLEVFHALSDGTERSGSSPIWWPNMPAALPPAGCPGEH